MFIPHAGAELFTVQLGPGPRTLVAHGRWTGSWELWTEPFTYLSKSWRVVAYDHRVPLEYSRWLASHIPHSQLHIVKGAGHVPTVTYPREVAEAITRFFGV